MDNQLLKTFFGEKYLDVKERRLSYDYIETFIENHHSDWSNAPDTDGISIKFAKEIEGLSKQDLAFLICHSGYIPELYGHDSSQETLYSKLIEVLVCEWAVKIGFTGSFVQTQKSSREDVTIIKDKTVIVCDAKSYRLGRSQAAPNVKDTLKKADYRKWLSNYPDDKFEPLAGLVTFPSLHKWRKGGDAILYATDHSIPIPILFYEQMAFFLVQEVGADALIDFIKKYSEHFPTPTSNQHDYLRKIAFNLFAEHAKEYGLFNALMRKILEEKARWTVDSIEGRLQKAKTLIKEKIEKVPVDKLKEQLIESEYQRRFYKVIRQIGNIRRFRFRN